VRNNNLASASIFATNAGPCSLTSSIPVTNSGGTKKHYQANDCSINAGFINPSPKRLKESQEGTKRIVYIRAVLRILCHAVDFRALVDIIGTPQENGEKRIEFQHLEAYERQENKHIVYWEWYFCYEKNSDMATLSPYIPVSEKVVASLSKQHEMHTEKHYLFSLFQHWYNGAPVRLHESDDLSDPDYYYFFRCRGELTRPQLFYLDVTTRDYRIDNSYCMYHAFIYNHVTKSYHGVVVDDALGTTTCHALLDDAIVRKYDDVFLETIKRRARFINNNVIMRQPGDIIPSLFGVAVPTDHPIKYRKQDGDTLAFTTVASALFLLKCHVAEERVMEQLPFYRRYMDYIYATDPEDKASIIKELQKHSATPSEAKYLKSQLHPFSFISERINHISEPSNKSSHKDRILVKKLTENFNLLAQYSRLRDKDAVLVTLYPNNHVVCIIKNYIIDSNSSHVFRYNPVVLQMLAFGSFGGIRKGIYIHQQSNAPTIQLLTEQDRIRMQVRPTPSEIPRLPVL
jgi:hypothetical protein